MSQWLIVGHGSVGSFLATRLSANDESVAVMDPHPRVPITRGDVISDVRELDRVDYYASCVRSESAESVAKEIGRAIEPDSIYFDWNTLSPAGKADIAKQLPATMID